MAPPGVPVVRGGDPCRHTAPVTIGGGRGGVAGDGGVITRLSALISNDNVTLAKFVLSIFLYSHLGVGAS